MATPGERWGTGYAVAAHPLQDGRFAVVTTAGVFLDDGTVEAVEIDAFDGSTQVQLTALASDESTLVVSTTAPPTLRWYDLTNTSPASVVELEDALSVQDFAFIGDGATLVATTPTGVVSWDAAAPTATPTVLHGPVGPMARTSQGVIAPALDSADLVVLDGTSVERRPVALPVDARLMSAKAAPGGGVVAVTAGVGANDFDRLDTVVVLDAVSLATVGSIAFEHPVEPSEWALTDDGVAVALGATLSIFALDGAPLVEATPRPDDPIQSAIETGSGVATIHQSGSAIAWNPPEWTPVSLHESDITVNFTEAEGGMLTTVDFYGRVTSHNIADGSSVELNGFGRGEATAIAVKTDGEQVAVATSAGQAVLLGTDLEPRDEIAVRGDNARVDTVEFHPLEAVVVTGLAERLGDLAFDDSVTMWNLDALEPRVTIGGESEDVEGCSFYINRVGFTTDGSLMSTVSHDFSVEIHDGSSGDYVVSLTPFSGTVLDTDFSVGGDTLVASADDSFVRVWDTEDFSELASYQGPPGGLHAFELMPDDDSMVATDVSGRLLLIDVLSGEELRTFAELGGRTSALALSHDGGIAAAAMPDGTIGLWSTTYGSLLTTLTGHAAPVTDIEFAPDGRTIYSSSRDGTVREWDLDVTSG